MNTIHYTPITHDLCAPVAELLRICFPDMLQKYIYTTEELEELADIYPEGTVIALDGDRPIGMGAGIMLDIDFDNLPPSEELLLYDDDDVCLHNMSGQYYYGSELGVHPDYRGRGIARQLYNRRKAEVTKHNKIGFVAAAVLPGYADHMDKLSIDTYVDKVVAGQLFDPTLTVQLRNGFHVVKLLQNFYLFPRSNNWCALIMWENDQYSA